MSSLGQIIKFISDSSRIHNTLSYFIFTSGVGVGTATV